MLSNAEKLEYKKIGCKVKVDLDCEVVNSPASINFYVLPKAARVLRARIFVMRLL